MPTDSSLNRCNALTGDEGRCLKQQLKNWLIAHRPYIDNNGLVMLEVRGWNRKG